jgi:hypothetical protein
MTSFRAINTFSQTTQAQDGSFTWKLFGKYSGGKQTVEHFPQVSRLQFRQCTEREKRNAEPQCMQLDRLCAGF